MNDNVENQKLLKITRLCALNSVSDYRGPGNEQIQKLRRECPQDSPVDLLINLLGTVVLLINYSFYDHVRLKCLSATIGFCTSCKAL